MNLLVTGCGIIKMGHAFERRGGRGGEREHDRAYSEDIAQISEVHSGSLSNGEKRISSCAFSAFVPNVHISLSSTVIVTLAAQRGHISWGFLEWCAVNVSAGTYHQIIGLEASSLTLMLIQHQLGIFSQVINNTLDPRTLQSGHVIVYTLTHTPSYIPRVYLRQFAY